MHVLCREPANGKHFRGSPYAKGKSPFFLLQHVDHGLRDRLVGRVDVDRDNLAAKDADAGPRVPFAVLNCQPLVGPVSEDGGLGARPYGCDLVAQADQCRPQ